MRFTSAFFATVLLAITVSSSPLQKRQDDDSSVDYVDVDLFALWDDAVAPTMIALPPAVETAANINTAAAASSISAELATSTLIMADSTPTGSVQKRVVTQPAGNTQQATCSTQQQRSLYMYTTSPDTPSNFQTDPTYSTAAKNAARYPPAGYTVTFNNLNGASLVPKGASYNTTFLSSYDANECASRCTQQTKFACRGFNIYFERDPQYKISKSDGSDCPGGAGVNCCTNPVSLTQIKCVQLGYAPSAAAATNKGQFQNKFQFVIAGSDGFSQNDDPTGLPNLDGYTRPHALGSCIPKAQPGGQLMTPTKFPGSTSFSDCAAYCTNIKGRTVNGVRRTCAYFVVAPTYDASDNSYLGLTCAPYTTDQVLNEGGTKNSDTTNCSNGERYYANAASYLRAS